MREVTPVPAASVLLLRDSPLEVLMIRRHQKSSFVPNAWVFPGGMVDTDDERGSILATMRVAAARELFEEAGIWLGGPLPNAGASRRALLARETTFSSLSAEAPIDLDRLVWTSRWITPAGVPKRFDTYFFLARADRDAHATVDDNEAVDALWTTPRAAIAALQIVFPTLKNLEAIADFSSVDELLAARREADIPTTRPRLVVEGGVTKIVMPE